MKEYKLEKKPVETKYTSAAAKYYKKRLSALVLDREFKLEQPARNTDEAIDKGVKSAKELGVKAEQNLVKFGDYLDKKFGDMFKK